MRRVTIVSALIVGLGTAASALASVVVSSVGPNPWFPSTGGTGTIEGQAGGQVTIVKTFTSIGDIPIILRSEPSAGVDTIHIAERIINNTGVTWTDFHFLMQPIDANGALTVSFANANNPTGEWGNLTAGVNSLTLDNGSVPNGGIFSIAFDLVVSSQQGSFDLFGIHEFPSVPEPSTLALLGCAALGLRRGKRRA